MANKRILFVRNNEALIKVDGPVGAVTLSLATDLLGVNEVLDGNTPTVNITMISWTGLPSGTFTVSRNGVNLIAGSGWGSLGSEGNVIETSFNTNDITITTATAETQIWIRVHKLKGYATKMEPEQFGQYDNINAVGS